MDDNPLVRDACVVAMTTISSAEYVVAALRAGASGYLVKDAGVRRCWYVPAVEHGLTPREVELRRLVGARPDQRPDRRPDLSVRGSVKQYLLHVGRKLDVTSRTGILIRAVQLTLVDPHALPSPR